MKLSIITVTFNSASTIEDTLRSVNEQDYTNIEHIVIDGGSTDHTVQLVEAVGERVTTVVSEPDDGIYSAMNKGLCMATGDVVAVLNSDDLYASPKTATTLMGALADTDSDIAFADIVYVRRFHIDRVVRYWKPGQFVSGSFSNGWVPPHPTFFARKAMYDKFGGFNERLRIAADFELMLRFFEVHKAKSVYVPHLLAKMRLGGMSNQSIKNIVAQNLEIVASLRTHGHDPRWVSFVTSKLIAKGRQFVQRPPQYFPV